MNGRSVAGRIQERIAADGMRSGLAATLGRSRVPAAPGWREVQAAWRRIRSDAPPQGAISLAQCAAQGLSHLLLRKVPFLGKRN